MAPRKIIWTPQCLSNLEQIAEYIAQDAPLTASKLVEHFLQSIERLPLFPYMGRVVPEIGKSNIRELISKNYRILYEVKEFNLDLLGIVHSRQQLDTNKFIKPDQGDLSQGDR